VGFATIALAIELGGTVGQSGVPFGTVLLGLGVTVSSSQQVSILQTCAKASTIGRVGALRQAVIGLTTAVTLPVVGPLRELARHSPRRRHRYTLIDLANSIRPPSWTWAHWSLLAVTRRDRDLRNVRRAAVADTAIMTQPSSFSLTGDGLGVGVGVGVGVGEIIPSRLVHAHPSRYW
jgi:hypothetical protein